MGLNGIVLINKNRGVSSNFVVNKVKHILHADKARHFGTLDVLGKGLLPVAIGKGTKLFDYFLNKDKVYKTTFKFGETSTTLDLEGEITDKNDVRVTKEDLEKVIPKFIGKLSQMPPEYSAKKIKGVPAYKLARSGQQVQLKPKDIEIYSIKINGEVDDNIFELEVWCSSGTYIRSLCRDIAQELNTFGIMSSIQRTKCGDFDIKDSVTLKELEEGKFNIITLDKVFNYPCINLSKLQAESLLNGVKIKTDFAGQFVKCYDENIFLGIGEISEGLLKLKLRLI